MAIATRADGDTIDATWFNDIKTTLDLLTTNGDVLYYNSGYQRLPKGADTEVLTLASGIPSWAASSGGGGSNFERVLASSI